MPDFKLVGAVAIKVRPDASKFRKETQAEISKQLAGYSADVKVVAKVKADTTEMKTDVDTAKKEVEAKKLTLKVGLDYDSIQKARAQLEAAVKGLDAKTINVKLDEKGIAAARTELNKMKRGAQIEMEFVPDEKGYQAVLTKIAEIRRQKLVQNIHFGWTEAELRKKESEMKAALKNSLTIQIHYGNDRASIEKAIAEVNGQLDKIREIKLDAKLNRKGLLAARKTLEDALAKAPVELRVNYKDQDSLKAVRDRLKTMLTELGTEPLKVNFNEKDLQAELARINGMIETELGPPHETTVHISYNNNRTSIEKAIAEIDAELAKIDAVKLDVELRPANLAFERARLQDELDNIPVKLEFDNNTAGLQAAKAKIEALLHVGKLHIETTLDEAALREQLLWVDARIKEAEQNKLKVDVVLNKATYLKAFAEIKLLAKNQTITIFTKMNNLGLLLAAAKLTGLRAASRWTEEFAQALGTLDRNLPIVAAAVVGLSTLASGALTLTADLFSLGNGIGQVARMAGVLAPAMILGLGAVMVVAKGVFKDFGAAVNGDTKALKALTPAGQEAANGVRTVFQQMRQTISANFWDRASDSMLRFTKTALPSMSEGLGGLATSLGGIFSHLLDSFSKFSEQSGLKTFFTNLNHGFDLAQTGLSDFMSGFLTLGVVGSTAFPRIARAFNDFATKFDAWVQRISADGTLQRWIDIGIQGMKDLGNIAGGLVKVWGNIGTAAQAAGVMTLHSFSQAMDRLDIITSGGRFQQNLKTIFTGARMASQTFHKALGDLGPAMDVFSVTVKNTLVGAAGALGAFIRVIGDVISSPKVGVGLTAFLSGVKSMFESLRPAAGDIANILMTFGQILGQVATDSGPLFMNLFHNLSAVLQVAWAALQPFLPGLIQLGTIVVDTLGPALGTVVREILPTFASGLQTIGNALLPVIQFLANFAAGAAILIASMPLPVLVGIATGILTIGNAIAFMKVVVPLATTAMEAFGTVSAITAARMQLMIPGVGILLAAATAIGAAALTSFATTQQSVTPYANEYASALEEDAKQAGALAGAVGQATTALALKNLVDGHAFEAAQKLGIGQQEVIDGLLKGGKAWDDIQAKITGAKKTYDNATTAVQNNAQAQDILSNTIVDGPTPAMKDMNDAANILSKGMNENRGSLQQGITTTKLLAQVNKLAGIETTANAAAQKDLMTEALATAKGLGAAAAATTTLTDSFSSNASKVDAMRKTFELLVPTDGKQKIAESLGAYVKGLNDIRDTAVPLAKEMQNLGNSVYGENGFLAVGSGNKAVMQLNQSLVDEVNNVWSGAKTAYDNALQQGQNTAQAFAAAQKFIDDHKGDYKKLATDSGVAADQVMGQWDKVFGHDWVLKVSLEGATEAAVAAQALINALGGSFDGRDFQAYLTANPDEALKAVTDAKGAAMDYVNHTWQTKLDATPKPAQDAITALLDQTGKTWVHGDFESILKVAKDVPGLAEAIQAIRNGAGANYQAIIFAAVNGISLAEAERELNNLAARRTAQIDVIINRSTMPDLNGADVSGNGRFGTNARGNILNGAGRPAKYFANGGIERHVAQIARPGVMPRVWAEAETQGEAYLPYAKSKRPRSVRILAQVAKDFGYTISRADQFANGGITAGGASTTSHTSADVHIGSITTVDMHAAVAKLRQSQRDALAVAGISSIGV